MHKHRVAHRKTCSCFANSESPHLFPNTNFSPFGTYPNQIQAWKLIWNLSPGFLLDVVSYMLSFSTCTSCIWPWSDHFLQSICGNHQWEHIQALFKVLISLIWKKKSNTLLSAWIEAWVINISPTFIADPQYLTTAHFSMVFGGIKKYCTINEAELFHI